MEVGGDMWRGLCLGRREELWIKGLNVPALLLYWTRTILQDYVWFNTTTPVVSAGAT